MKSPTLIYSDKNPEKIQKKIDVLEKEKNLNKYTQLVCVLINLKHAMNEGRIGGAADANEERVAIVDQIDTVARQMLLRDGDANQQKYDGGGGRYERDQVG